MWETWIFLQGEGPGQVDSLGRLDTVARRADFTDTLLGVHSYGDESFYVHYLPSVLQSWALSPLLQEGM